LRNRQPKSLGGLEVNDQLELGGLFDGEVAGFGAFEDLVYERGGAPKQISKVWSIGHKAPGIDIRPLWVHCRQPVLSRQFHEASALAVERAAWQHTQGTRARPGHI